MQTIRCNVWAFALLLAAPAATRCEDSKPDVVVRVAAVSFVPTKFDLQGNADRLERALRSAKEGGAQLAVAPEGTLDGYVVNEIIGGDAAADRMKEVAVAIDDPVIKRFQRLAAELQMCLVFGFAELIDGDVFNCAVFIDEKGKIRGKYHKMQFAEGYDPAWWFNRLGKTSRAFDTPFGRCGLMICNDRWNPQLARIPVLDGAQFLVIPAFGSRSEAQDKAVLSRGRENNVPVIEANVGVTLLVSEGKIAAVDREKEGITFGEITIPPPVAAKTEQRDKLEKQFLTWRAEEMIRRLEKTKQRLQREQDKAIESLKKLGAKIRLDEEGEVVEVNLQERRVTDDDLAHLAKLKHLQEISLHQTLVTGAGLQHLKSLTNLERLFLTDTKTDDDGLRHLSQLAKLKVLGLSGTNVTNAGLAQLTELRMLKSLFLLNAKTKVASIQKLSQSLPTCVIVH